MYQIQTANDQYRIKTSGTGISRSGDVASRYMRRYQNFNKSSVLLSDQIDALCYLVKSETNKFELTEEQSRAFDKALMASGRIISKGQLLVR